MENLLLEDGSRLLLENGEGIFLESYVPPNIFLTPAYAAGDAVMGAVLRPNTPKFIASLSFVAGHPVMTTGAMVSSAPAKFINSLTFVGGDTVMTMATAPSVVSPRHLTPPRHYVWVHDLNGERVNVIV